MSEQSRAVVECDRVTRRFGAVTAVDGVSLTVEEGEIVGVVGPNGAGKTTLLSMMNGLDRPTSGTVRVLAMDPWRDREDLARRVGVQLQSAALPPRITTAEALRLFSAFYPDPRPWPDLLERLGIPDKADTRVDRLSGGERQRVFIALSLLHRPELVFLDELTTALDPRARRDMWDVVDDVRRAGTTVVLTTHYMEEAEHLCDRVAIMDDGAVVASGTVAALLAEHAPPAVVEFRVAGGADVGFLRGLPEVDDVEQRGDRVRLRGGSHATQDAVVELGRRGVAVTDVRTSAPSLDDVFLAVTGRRLEHPAAGEEAAA